MVTMGMPAMEDTVHVSDSYDLNPTTYLSGAMKVNITKSVNFCHANKEDVNFVLVVLRH